MSDVTRVLKKDGSIDELTASDVASIKKIDGESDPSALGELGGEVLLIEFNGVADGRGFSLAHTVLRDKGCLLYTSPSPRDGLLSRMPSSA